MKDHWTWKFVDNAVNFMMGVMSLCLSFAMIVGFIAGAIYLYKYGLPF